MRSALNQDQTAETNEDMRSALNQDQTAETNEDMRSAFTQDQTAERVRGTGSYGLREGEIGEKCLQKRM